MLRSATVSGATLFDSRTRCLCRPQHRRRQRKATRRSFSTLSAGVRFVRACAKWSVSSNESHQQRVRREDGRSLHECADLFSEERRRELSSIFIPLEPGGYLFLGHSESISKMPVKFQAIVLNDCILYRKPTADEVHKAELVAEGRA